MASPEVERPMTSPSHPIVPGGYPRPPVSSSSEKRKAFNFRYKKFGSFANSSQQQKTGFGNSISSAAAAAAAAASAAAAARRSSGSGSGPKTSGSIPVRKRSYSFSEGHSKSVTSVTPSKRWKKSKDAKKFLHGGNIRDPLNLNSLSDEKVAKVVNAVTPKSSPIPTPKHRKAEYKIEVFIPPNISDPLNLMQDDINDDEYDASFKQKKSRPRKRNHNRKPDGDSSPKAAAAAAAAVVEEVKKVRFQEEIHEENYKKVTIQHQEPSETIKDLINMEEITAEEKETKITTTNPPNEIKSSSSSETPTRTGGKKRRQTFEYGNYSRYYGYRRDPGDDSRLQYFNPDWFRGKDILDIGCNVGEVTMAIARDMCAKSILGIDIDPSLINKARKTVKQYANSKVPSAMATPNPGMDPSLTSLSKTEQLFPQSLPLLFGPLDPTKPDQQYQQQPKIPFSSQIFPNNIKFLCDNYVFESDELLDIVQPEFDSILCLSTTKWLQLNFGDEGLKRAFKRMFKQLRPNGVLILEPQGMASYSKKARKINDTTKEHFKNMKLKPEMFVDYLTTEVGFTGGEVVAVPEHSAAGFRRPIHVFKKP